MPISTDQKLNLYKVARDHWLEVHWTLSAYNRDYLKNREISKWLRRGTFVSALITAFTAIPVLAITQFTMIPGILTAILAAVEQSYNPLKNSQTFWDCKTQLEGIKKDIVLHVLTIDNATDLTSGMDQLSQIGKRITEGTKVPFEILAIDKKTAQEAFQGSVIDGLIERYEQNEFDMDENHPSALGFDAPDIIEVARQSNLSKGV